MNDTAEKSAQQNLSGSYTAIDYRLRPAKHAERAMLVEAAARLRFADLQSYRYIGFGAIYFSDFKAFHRSIGITDFHNIEGRIIDKARFNWNRPFKNIRMHFGMSGEILPKLGWSKRSIVWLDYDGQLDSSKLKDIDYIVRNCASGSFLVVSVNAEKPAPVGVPQADREADLIEALKLLVGPERVRPSLKESELRGQFASKVYYQIMTESIESSISIHNRVVDSDKDKLVWKQIAHITYKDGARMLTVGGVIYKKRDEEKYNMGQFERLSFFREADEPFKISVPKLTLKEMAHLEKSALGNPEKCSTPMFLKDGDRRDFLKLLRYLPSYVSADL